MYSRYQEHIINDVQTNLEEMSTQPILFIGSGLSKRYFGAPNWKELLQLLKERCPIITHGPAYYLQDGKSLSEIGSIYTKLYREWAWSNQQLYPSQYFETDVPKDIYIKYEIKRLLEEITPRKIDDIKDENLKEEIKILQDIQPHALITTNYDNFLENFFGEYQSIVGQKVLRPDTMCIGEIFKIHGCVSDISEIILNEEDYDVFIHKKKYLSAKLLTFFAEHPLLFIGYSANDKNILSILSDIDELISISGEIIPNIYFLEFDEYITEKPNPRTEKVILVNDREIRVKSIVAKDYKWILRAFASRKAVENVHPKLLRALMARTYKLVRSDIPSKSVEVNFEMLAEILNDDKALPKLYGITMVSESSDININFPYTLSELGKRLGYKGLHGADNLIYRIKKSKGIDIKATDNKYHVFIKAGRTSGNRKYSHAALKLLADVRDQKEYQVEM
ncbi:SIR2 family protein [Lysinibacillus fusiformis]|uniref:SIR2 family protein n=1 Tax=Lysinibacillus fusiformis TaxID=28031 RepID=UPI002E9F4C83|nr:SIR2 family protein [Lysinibacillus fusiformis]